MTRSRTDNPRRTPPHAAADLARLRRLADLVDALRRGASFPITRLTVVKALCREPKDATAFLAHLAEAAYADMVRGRRPEALTAREWTRHRRLGAAGLRALEQTVGASRTAHALEAVLRELQAAQSEERPVPFGTVRLVTDRPLLVIEDALRGVVEPAAGARWAYQASRDFAERYDPSHGAGLIPASADALAAIVSFWNDRLATRTRPSVSRRASPTRAGRRAATPAVPSLAEHPALDAWVREQGWIELGYTEGSRAFVKVLDEGGMIWEGASRYGSIANALSAAERATAAYIAKIEPSWVRRIGLP